MHCNRQLLVPGPLHCMPRGVFFIASQLQGLLVVLHQQLGFGLVEVFELRRQRLAQRVQQLAGELPVAVTPYTRVPAIGTTLLVAPAWVRAKLIDWMARRAFFNLELHGIDFADAEQDGIPGELVNHQPDLHLPIEDKLDRLDTVLDEVARRWDFATLAEIAADVQRNE